MVVCPKCQNLMRTYERNGVHLEQCEGCRGIFLDRGELEQMTNAEQSFYGSAPPFQPDGGHRHHGGHSDSPRPYQGHRPDSPGPYRGGHGGGHYEDSPRPYGQRRDRGPGGFLRNLFD
ncbi:zf-TFIIB domain-containing protein [Actinoalloteichus sp. GBA129-24]|nr:zf-TFIIB domain-containing protein [Actinoalloteichus sp. GBA129-24]